MNETHGSDEVTTAVSVLGLGQLGRELATAFLNDGHATTVWNRTSDKANALSALGATATTSARDAVSASPLVVVCVSDYDAVREILEPVDDVLPGRVVVNLSSGTPDLGREMAAWVAERGATYLDGAAMSGTKLVGQREALFLFSGPAGTFEEHEPVLTSLGNAVHLGADAGLASLYDAALFGVAWGALLGYYHGAALVGTEKVDATAFASVVVGHLPFLGGLMRDHARQIEDGRYPSDDGTVEVHAAAMEHLVSTSSGQGIGADVPELVNTLLHRTIAAGRGSEGIASVIEAIRKPEAAR